MRDATKDTPGGGGSDGNVRIHLVGTFRIEGSGGRDLTPRGAKARGLIGLLATAAERRRTRRWIEAKLWSDRDAPQASGSLRQTLTEIRRALGEAGAHLGADRDSVWLDREGTWVDLTDGAAEAGAALRAGRELLEGLAVRDREFEDWLRNERACALENAERAVASPAQAAAQDPAAATPLRCTLHLQSPRALSEQQVLAVRVCTEVMGSLLGTPVRLSVSPPGGERSGDFTRISRAADAQLPRG